MGKKSLFENLVLFLSLSSLIHAANIENYKFWEVSNQFPTDCIVMHYDNILPGSNYFSLREIDDIANEKNISVPKLRFPGNSKILCDESDNVLKELQVQDLGNEKFIFDGTFKKIVNKCWKHENDQKETVYCLKPDQIQKLIHDKNKVFYFKNEDEFYLNFDGKTKMKIKLNDANMTALKETERQEALKLNVKIKGEIINLKYHKQKLPGSKEVWVIVLILSTISAIWLVLRYYFNCFLPSEAELREHYVKEEKLKNAKMMDKTAQNLTKATEIGMEAMQSISGNNLLDGKFLPQNNTEEESSESKHEDDDDHQKKKQNAKTSKKSKSKKNNKKQTLSDQLKALCEDEDIEIVDW